MRFSSSSSSFIMEMRGYDQPHTPQQTSEKKTGYTSNFCTVFVSHKCDFFVKEKKRQRFSSVDATKNQ